MSLSFLNHSDILTLMSIEFELPVIDENPIEGFPLEVVPIKPEANPLVAKQLAFFKELFRPVADLVYYPCCEADISPSEVFKDSSILYVDINEQATKALAEKGYQAYACDVFDFIPGQVDILILLNPVIRPDSPAHFVKKGGYILCNNYHATASNLSKNPEYELKGVVVEQNSDRHVLGIQVFDMTTDPDDLFIFQKRSTP
jgi:hypothetical protein